MLAIVGTRQPSPPPPVATPLASQEVDLALDQADVAHLDEPLPYGATAAAAVAPREVRGDRSNAKVAPPSALSDKAGPSQEDALPASPEPAGSAWSFSPTSASPAPIDLRAGVTPDLVAPAHARSELPAGASATGGLAEGLAARDVELGLGRGGPVLTAVEDATRMSDDPVDGNATFGVSVFSDGAVVATLLGASSHSASWSRVADAIGHTLDPRRMRLPPGGRGWRVVVHVEAQTKLADGRDVRTLHGLRASVTPSALQDQIEGKPGARGSSTGAGGPDHVGGDPADAPPVGGFVGRGPTNGGAGALTGIAARVLPTPTVSISGKVCSASLSITPLGIGLAGGCSVENIGTPAQRVVSGQIVSESAL